MIYCADNLDVMRNLPSESIDLIYIDPPFFSNRKYETIWGDKNDTASFNDRWKGGINHYSEWMRPRLEQIHRLLKPSGALFCHLDWHAVHYIKVLLDEIFDSSNFRNEIVWQRTPFSGSSKSKAHKVPAIHDTILYYAKTKKHDKKFNCPTLGYTDEYLKRFKHKDKRGYYRKSLLKTYSKETFERLKKEDRLVEPVKKGANYSYKQYLHESSGKRQIGDVWTDINMLNPASKERVGYPTQKPEELLRRVIEMATKKGDIVADFFCGCGTTLVAAHNLNRDYIGVDNSPMASKIIRKRLKGIGIDVPELAVKTLTKSQNNEAQAI